MDYIGYINITYYFEQIDEVVSRMKQLPCTAIYYDDRDDVARERWKAFIGQLHTGDVAVIMSFDNACKNFNDMMFFLKLCSSKDIRIISLSDALDTADELFPKSSTKNTLAAIARMSANKGEASFDDFQAELLSDKFHEKKLKKYRMVINMYNAGYSIKEIMARTGYHGKSNIYRILHRFNVDVEYPTMVRSKQSGQHMIMRNL